jgi:hypothetical protein
MLPFVYDQDAHTLFCSLTAPGGSLAPRRKNPARLGRAKRQKSAKV